MDHGEKRTGWNLTLQLDKVYRLVNSNWLSDFERLRFLISISNDLIVYHSVKRKTPWEDLVYKSTHFADFCPLSVPPIMGGQIPLVLTLLYGNCPLIFKHACTFSKHSILFLRLIYRCLTFFSTSIVNCNFETFCSCKFISCVLKSEYILLIIILLLNKLSYMVSAHL